MTTPTFEIASPYPQPGEVLGGKYRIEHLLGEGGMGAVAKATNVLLKAPVALKFMSPAVVAMAGAVDRFLNEGVAARKIDSDHVVKVFDVDQLPSGSPYLVMEYLEGRDLADVLAREGRPLDAPRAVHFVLQMLRGLHAAHSVGIIHRDMKPSNCFVITKDGEPDFVKLVDFGISKVRSDEAEGKGANLTRTNSALGTPLYMSAEQARSPRDVDARSDLYSVGAILYELLSCRTPYTSTTGEFTEILFKIFTTDPDPLNALRPDLPPGLIAVVHRALARDPNARHASALEMAEALFPYADERSGQVVAKIAGAARARASVIPGHRFSVRPADSTPGLAHVDATAKTHAGPMATPPPAKISTDAAVVRESGTGGGKKPGAAMTLIAALMLFAAAGAGGVVMVRARQGAAGPAPSEPAPSAPQLPAATPPPSADSVRLAPPPSPPPSSVVSATAPLPSQGTVPTSSAPKPPPRANPEGSSTPRPNSLKNVANSFQ